ncbi:Contactin-6 [Trichoplax sp. H2]|nr:Contactin-6 [Trichoplax sp. H2]|eukprot:RDD38015.1 Contactin-6 [Trichoplax sp. H2]
MVWKLTKQRCQWYFILLLTTLIRSNHANDFKVNFRLQPLDYQGKHAISPRYYRGNLTLTCQLEESLPNQRVTYYWTHNQQPIQLNDRLVLQNGNLTFNLIRLSDAGNYQCFAIHNYGISVSRIATLQLRHLLLPFNQFDNIHISTYSFQSGQYAQLTCPIPVQTNPSPNTIYWTRDNDHFIDIEKYPHLYQSIHDGTLHFTSVGPSDTSTYRCHSVFQLYDPIAHNYVTVVNHGRRQLLNISFTPSLSELHKPISIVAAPIDQIVQAGQSQVHFQCVVTGNSAFKIRWYKLHGFLPPHRFQLSNNQYRLTIANIQQEDEGQYYCQINDNYGHTISQHLATLTVIVPPKWKNGIQDITVSLHRTSFAWHCQASGSYIHYRWYANGNIISNTTKHRIYSHNGTLIIQSLQQSDTKVYTCMATNQFGNIVKSAIANFVFDSVPSFLIRPFAITKWIINRRNRIICKAVAFPKPIISFMKDNHNLSAVQSSKYTIIPSNGTLIVHHVEFSDQGSYKCIASNRNGSIAIQTNVIIIPSFQVVFNHNKLVIKRGKRIRLTCNIQNHQYGLNHSILWSFTTSNTSKRIITANESSSMLIIDKSTIQDGGLYICRVLSYVHDYGYVRNTGSAKVNVIDIPHQPKYLRINQVSSRSITLSWQQQILPEKPLTYFQIDYQLRSTRRWNQRFVPADSFSGPSTIVTTVLDNLIPYHHYILKVAAINAVGQSQYTQEYKVTTLTDKPAMAPTQFYASTTGASYQFITISWIPLPQKFHNGPNLNYRLYYRPYRSGWQVKEVDNSGQYTLQDVLPNLKYNFYLVAWNSVGESEMKTPTATVKTSIPPPTSLPPFPKLYVIGLSVIRVRFENVWNSAEVKISQRNKIYFWKEGAALLKPTSIVVYNLSDIVLHSVQQGAVYKFQLCANGDGGDSQIKRITTVNVTNPVPDRIRDVTFTRQNTSGVIVKWKTPSWLDFKTSYQYIEYYRVEYFSLEDPTYPRISTVTSNPIYSIEELPEGSYTFTITARGHYGYGVPMDISYDMTHCQVPSTPHSLTIKSVEVESFRLLLEWKTYDLMESVGFIIQYKIANSQYEFQNITDNIVRSLYYYIPTKLLNLSSQGYQFRIRAVLCSSISIPSNIASYTPMQEIPSTHFFNNPWHIFLIAAISGIVIILMLLGLYYLVHRPLFHAHSVEKKNSKRRQESTVSARQIINSCSRTKLVATTSFNYKNHSSKTNIA